MLVMSKGSHADVCVPLPRRSMYLFCGDARYVWKHGMRDSPGRISITYRIPVSPSWDVKKKNTEGSSDTACGLCRENVGLPLYQGRGWQGKTLACLGCAEGGKDSVKVHVKKGIVTEARTEADQNVTDGGFWASPKIVAPVLKSRAGTSMPRDFEMAQRMAANPKGGDNCRNTDNTVQQCRVGNVKPEWPFYAYPFVCLDPQNTFYICGWRDGDAAADKKTLGRRKMKRLLTKVDKAGAASSVEYVVERLEQRRQDKKTEEWEYLVKWAGYHAKSNTWEPESGLPRHVVDQFHVK